MVDFKKWLAKRDVWKLIDPPSRSTRRLTERATKVPSVPRPGSDPSDLARAAQKRDPAGLSQNATVGVTNPGNGGAQSQGSLK